LERPTPEQVRAEFLEMLTGDWVGPAGGENEIVYEHTVRDRYLTGMLAPDRKTSAVSGANEGSARPDNSSDEEEIIDPIDEQGELAVGGADEGDDGTAAPPVPDVGDTAAFIPSSFGLTVSLAEDAQALIAEVQYGRYERHIDEATGKRYWQRIPIYFIS